MQRRLRHHLIRGTFAVLGGLLLVALEVALLMGRWALPVQDPESPARAEVPELMMVSLFMFVGATAFNGPHTGRGRALGMFGIGLLLAATAGDFLAAAGAGLILLLTYLVVWPFGLLVFGIASVYARAYPAWCRFFPLVAAAVWYPGLVLGWVLPIGIDAAFAPVTLLLGTTWIAFGAMLIRGYPVPAASSGAWLPVPTTYPDQ